MWRQSRIGDLLARPESSVMWVGQMENEVATRVIQGFYGNDRGIDKAMETTIQGLGFGAF